MRLPVIKFCDSLKKDNLKGSFKKIILIQITQIHPFLLFMLLSWMHKLIIRSIVDYIYITCNLLIRHIKTLLCDLCQLSTSI